MTEILVPTELENFRDYVREVAERYVKPWAMVVDKEDRFAKESFEAVKKGKFGWGDNTQGVWRFRFDNKTLYYFHRRAYEGLSFNRGYVCGYIRLGSKISFRFRIGGD